MTKEYSVYAAAWTEGSIYCYKRGCNCQGCYMKDLIESMPCRMKSAVLELVRKFGKPNETKDSDLREIEQKIIEAINSDCDSFESIAEYIGRTTTATQSLVHGLYKKAKEYYGWKPIKKGIVHKSLLPDFIRWVRKGEE